MPATCVNRILITCQLINQPTNNIGLSSLGFLCFICLLSASYDRRAVSERLLYSLQDARVAGRHLLQRRDLPRCQRSSMTAFSGGSSSSSRWWWWHERSSVNKRQVRCLESRDRYWHRIHMPSEYCRHSVFTELNQKNKVPMHSSRCIVSLRV